MNSILSRLTNIIRTIPEHKLYLFLIVLVGLSRFINLGFHDLQAWDESLYAVRAIGVVELGHWIDQTEVSIDGLYSSFHPPLHVWLTSLAYFLFGINEFSARFISALLGGILLLVIYFIGKELHSPKAGVFSSLLFALNPFVTFYSRQGQLDMTMTFFITLSGYFIIRGLKGGRTLFYPMAGIALGCALLSRSFVGLGIALAFLFFILLQSEKRQLLKSFFIVSLLGSLIPFPWYLYMTLVHGSGDPFFFLTSADLWKRIVLGFEENIKPLGPMYYLNQLFVLLPAGVIWFFAGTIRIIRERDYFSIFLLIWFLTFFIVFSAVESKLAVYILPALIPFSLIAGKEIATFLEKKTWNRSSLLILAATMISFVWSLNQEWRDAVRTFFSGLFSLDWTIQPSMDGLIHFSATIIFTLFFLYLIYRFIPWSRFRRFVPVAYFFPLFFLTLFHIMVLNRYQYDDGAARLARFLASRGYSKLVVAGYERNPQLTYYLNGIDIGWRDDVIFERIVPPKDSLAFRSWLSKEIQSRGSDYIFIIEKDKFIRYHSIDAMRIAPLNYSSIFESKRYTVLARVIAPDLAKEGARNNLTPLSVYLQERQKEHSRSL